MLLTHQPYVQCVIQDIHLTQQIIHVWLIVTPIVLLVLILQGQVVVYHAIQAFTYQQQIEHVCNANQQDV
jgi:hypothetical protein